MLRDHVIAAIDAYREVERVSDTEVSRRAQVHERTVMRLRRGDNIGAESLEALFALVCTASSCDLPGGSTAGQAGVSGECALSVSHPADVASAAAPSKRKPGAGFHTPEPVTAPTTAEGGPA